MKLRRQMKDIAEAIGGAGYALVPPRKRPRLTTAPQRVPGLSYPRELQPGTNNWGRRWPGAPWQPVVELW